MMDNALLSRAFKRRDVVVEPVQSHCVLSSIDFSQCIGPRHSDMIKAQVGANAYFVARAAVAELTALGATPTMLLVGNSSVLDKTSIETALDMLISEIGGRPAVQFSHENYSETQESAIAVTAVALAKASDLRIMSNSSNTFAYYSAMVLPEALDPDDFHLRHPLSEISTLLRMPQIVEIIPGGSRGVAADISALCEDFGFTFVPSLEVPAIELRLREAAGPGCKFLVLASSPINVEGYDLVGTFCRVREVGAATHRGRIAA